MGARRTLLDACDVGHGDVVALVGGGGKTSLMLRLADEWLATESGRVLLTTTTKIWPPAAPAALGAILFVGEEGVLLDRDGYVGSDARLILVAAGYTAEGKLSGVAPESIPWLRERLGAALVIVEADGSRGLPFKAPRAHDPVIPAATTVVIAVTGADAIGQPLDDRHVHRAASVAALGGIPLGAPLGARVLARMITHPLGPSKGRPRDARFVAVINKADTPSRAEAARTLARHLAMGPGDRTIVMALQDAQPVKEVVSS